MDLRKLIEDYLKEARLMQVATSKDNQPWVASVYFAFDEKLSLYWISNPTRRHSKEIKDNEKVAGTIVLPHSHGEKVRGLQFQGIAKQLEGKEVEEGIECYSKRYLEVSAETKKSHDCYKITPKLFVLFDEVNFPNNPRQELFL